MKDASFETEKMIFSSTHKEDTDGNTVRVHLVHHHIDADSFRDEYITLLHIHETGNEMRERTFHDKGAALSDYHKRCDTWGVMPFGTDFRN